MSAQVREIDARDWSHKTRFCARETVKLRDDTEITLRELTVPEFREWRKLAESLDDDAGQDSFLCRCICDETGRPLTGADEIVSALPVSEYARVSDIAAELNGIGQKKSIGEERRFLFRLALALGKTVAELERDLTYRELVEWLDFYREEPFGAIAQDLRFGNIATLVHTAVSKKATTQPGDWRVRFPTEETAERERQERLAAKAEAIFRSLKARQDAAKNRND